MSRKPPERAASSGGQKTVAQNRRALHEYSIEERYEAGIALAGAEVKSLREGGAHLREAYATVRDGEVWIHAMRISPYSSASTHEPLDPERPRKLLLRREEIDKLAVETGQRGYTLVPLRLYFSRGIAKLELGLGKGKKLHDRRREIAAREAQREIDRAARHASR